MFFFVKKRLKKPENALRRSFAEQKILSEK